MKKYKVCVYAICKNESKFIKKWYKSMKEADKIFVLDTGSNDDSVEKLSKLKKVVVKSEKIVPWRFDVARNMSLDMVDSDCDICICTDFDEILLPGWRKELEKNWNNKVTRVRYNYNWSLDEKNNPIINFYLDNIHTRNNYIWHHPVHEVLKYVGEGVEEFITLDKITLNHYPDITKSRANYLPLLELSVKEEPNDDRNVHYLGREYMYHRRWNECIDTLIKHLSLKSATWNDERAASMRFISRAYIALKRYEEAKMWLLKAIEEAPHLRDGYVELAILESNLGNYDEVVHYCNKALEIKEHQKTYINEPFSWDNTIYDLLSIAYYHKNNFKKSLENINIALELAPENERLKKNKIIIKSKCEE